MVKLVKVNTLAVAKRWKARFVREKKLTGAEKRIGIWELPYQTDRSKSWGHTSDTRYVVGNVQAVKSRVSHLGERVDGL